MWPTCCATGVTFFASITTDFRNLPQHIQQCVESRVSQPPCDTMKSVRFSAAFCAPRSRYPMTLTRIGRHVPPASPHKTTRSHGTMCCSPLHLCVISFPACRGVLPDGETMSRIMAWMTSALGFHHHSTLPVFVVSLSPSPRAAPLPSQLVSFWFVEATTAQTIHATWKKLEVGGVFVCVH